MGKLQVSIDQSDRARLHLRGDGRGADFGAFEDAAVAILEATPSGLVVDLDGLSAGDGALVDALNGVGKRAAASGLVVVVEVPVGALDWLAEAPLHRAVRMEPTAAPVRRRAELVPARPERSAPSPGAPRREGHGFITSYGSGRPCAEPGCATTLSRYNNHDRCAVHWLGVNGRR